ncbi:hypothetical protein MHYP_G00313700 [Metynnis hypsauchen]
MISVTSGAACWGAKTISLPTGIVPEARVLAPSSALTALFKLLLEQHFPPLPLLRLELLPCRSVVSARCPVVHLPREIDEGGSCATGGEDAVSEMDVVYEALLCMIDV